MNERIKALAEQADINLSDRDGWWIAYDEDLERFAELVRQDERERIRQEDQRCYVERKTE
jgi:hypothetical protein